MSRYRFGDFTLCPRRRLLLRGAAPVPLIPKYFDLLRLLIERRHEALDRREIFDRIWTDVVVSDGALSQAIRTLRRALHDDPRAPRYIRTVSRHGYQFVFEPVTIEEDEAPVPSERSTSPPAPATAATGGEYDVLVARLVGTPPYQNLSDDERREAAEQLHAHGTQKALQHLDTRPGRARGRALLRDSRWDVPGAGEVPLLTAPEPLASVTALVQMRLAGAARAAASRLGAAAGGGALAGILGGTIGGIVLMLPAGSPVTSSTMIALAIIGCAAGAFGAAGIGSGLAAAEVLARSRRRLALAGCGALSGLVAATVAHVAVRAVFGSVVGRSPATLGGPLEGWVMGLAAGIGYAWSTPTPHGGGMATPRGRARLVAAVATALCCAAAGAALGAMGGKTVSVTLDAVSDTYAGSQVGLAPLAQQLGEREFRPVTRTLVSAFEGLLFGFGLVFGLTHRPALSPSKGPRSG